MIDSTAHVIKGAVLGALGGLLLPVVWMSVIFGGPTFIAQFSDGSSLPAILTSLIAIPFSTMWRGLLEGGLITTTIFGLVSGILIAILTLALRSTMDKRRSALVAGALALLVFVLVALTQSIEITLATGLIGAQIWVLGVLYVAGAAWLGYKLREVYIA